MKLVIIFLISILAFRHVTGTENVPVEKINKSTLDEIVKSLRDIVKTIRPY